MKQKSRCITPYKALFCPIFYNKMETFRALIQDVMKIFTDACVKQAGKKLAYFGHMRRRDWNFWPKYLPLYSHYNLRSFTFQAL